jgi:hypothetical protein
MKKMITALFAIVLICNFSFAQSTAFNKQTKEKVKSEQVAKNDKSNCAKSCSGKSSASFVSTGSTSASHQLDNCSLKGTEDCPLIKNCPLKGTSACPYTHTLPAEPKQSTNALMENDAHTPVQKTVFNNTIPE